MSIFMKIFCFALVILIILISLGNLLAVNDMNPNKKAGAIVAISGGNTNYRTQHAVDLFKQGKAPLLIFAGAAADTSGPSNAKVMKTYAISEGVSTDDIIMEEHSKNTLENAKFVKEILRKKKINSIILVTSGYHELRAKIEFQKALAGTGVEVIASPAYDPDWKRTWFTTGKGWYLAFSEFGGVIKAWSTKGDS